MATKKNIAPQDLLQTDGIFTVWEKMYAYVLENYRPLAAIGLALCVVIAGVLFWMARQHKAEQDGMVLFYEAMAAFEQRPAEKADPAQQYALALEKFTAASSNHPETYAGKAALFYAAAASYRLNKYDEAIKLYQAFLNKADERLAFLEPAACEGIGYSFESQGDYRTALEWYERQQNARYKGANAFALLNLGRCFEAVQDRDKACQRYKEFLEQSPGSVLRDLAQAKVAALCG